MTNNFNDWIKELKDSVDIVRLIEQYLPLTKKGSRYWACCPFHNEKTPSFLVDEEQQYYKCYGCGKSGDIIEFVKEKEKLEFMDAVEFIANKFGIEMPERQFSADAKDKKRDLENIYNANLLAAKFYRDNLQKPEAKEARDYLHKRGFNDETIARFGLGCSLDYESLYNHLISQGISDETITKAALVNESKGDFLAMRLVIPIIETRGKIVGFSGRALTGDTKPKYKNSPTTIAFDKSQTLYNMNIIRTLRQKEDVKNLILVEGYMDVMSLYEVGIKNVIASMGTAFTLKQCQAISRVVKQVYVCFDGDAAGQGATIRSLDLLADEDVDVRVVTIPDNMDPDDYIRQFGVSSFDKLLAQAEPVTQFKIRKLKESADFSTIEGKPKFVKETIPILSKLDSITRSTYVDYVSQISGIPKEVIEQAIVESKGNKPSPVVRTVATLKKDKNISNADIDRGRIVLAAWLFGQFDLNIDEFTNADMFKTEDQKNIASKFLEEYTKNNRLVFKDLWSHEVGADGIRNELNVIDDKREDWKSEYGMYTYEDAIKRLMKDYLQKVMENIVEDINRSTNDEEKSIYEEKLDKVLAYQRNRGL
ncbi:MAG TPA: DNA primase [Clostridia bacterium]|jgi:DNA primase|nr:DNA primase [Clostridia bacterium]